MSYFPTISACLSLWWACSVHVVITTSPTFIFMSSHMLIFLLVVHILFIQVYLSILYLLSCVRVFEISSFLHILITMFRSGSVRSVNFTFVHSLYMSDIIRSRIMLSFTWSKPHFSGCEIMFKKERSVSPSFWFLLLKT